MKQVIVNNYKIFKNEAGTCQAVFKYWWAFEPYDSSDRTFKLSLNVTPVKGEGLDSSLDEDHFLCFPELITVLAKLQKKYNGEISAKDYRDVTYSFNNVDFLFEFINTASAVMRVNGIPADIVIDRAVAFPSVEYANDMIAYTLKSDISLMDIERHMLSSARLGITMYQEFITGDRSIPISSHIKFDPEKTLCIKEYLGTFIGLLSQDIDNKMSGVSELMNKLKKAVGTPQNNVLSEQLSDDVSLTESFWV